MARSQSSEYGTSTPTSSAPAASAIRRQRRQNAGSTTKSHAAIPNARSPTSGWTPSPTPNAAAAATSQPPARCAPSHSAARHVNSSQMTSATNRTFAACTSARVAFSHGSAANANAAPAIPAAAARRSRLRSVIRWPLMSVTSPAASATQTADSMFMRQATSPIGRRVHSQPRIS